MAEALFRLKSAGGGFTWITGTAPITATGLNEGEVYEYPLTDGTIGEVTAGVDVIAAGAIADQTFDENDGVKTVDVSGDFTNADTLALQTAPSGVTISGGIVSIDTGATGTLSSSSIVVRGTTNTGTDFADSAFSLTVEDVVAGDTTAPTRNSDSYTDATRELTIDASDASGSVTVIAATVATSGTSVTKADIENGTGNALDTFSETGTTGENTYTATFTDETATAIKYFLRDPSGNDSAIFTISPIVVDDTAAVLSSVVDAADGETAATWGVTSDTAEGTIYAGLRLAADPQLSASDIINTTGDCIATDTDASPTADAANGGAFSGLTTGVSYVIDVTQVDDYGNTTTPVSGDGFTPTAAASGFPTLEETASGNSGSATSHSCDISGLSIDIGDLLVFEYLGASGSNTSPAALGADWTLINRTSAVALYSKVADGTEGSSLTYTTTFSTYMCWAVRRFTGASGTIDIATGTDALFDSQNLAMSDGQQKYLVGSAVTARRSDYTFGSAPAGYTIGYVTEQNQNTSSDTRTSMASAMKEVDGTSENPGAFSYSGGTTPTQPDGITYAVHPAA